MSNPTYYGACEDINAVIPPNVWPEKTHGVEKAQVTFAAPTAGALLRIDFHGFGVNVGGTSSIMAALFIDDEQFAREVSMPNPFAANFMTPVNLLYFHAPGDTAPHTYRLHLGKPSSGSPAIRMNGTSTGPFCDGALKCTLAVTVADNG